MFDSQDPNALVDSVKPQLDSANTAHREVRRFFREGESEREICWARFVPPCRIGDAGPKTFERRVIEGWRGDWPVDLTEPVWETAYATTPIVIFGSGVVAADTTKRFEGLQALNTFFGACDFAGHACAPTTLYELGYMSVSPTGCTGSWGGPAHVGRAFGTGAGAFPVDILERALKVTERVSKDKDLALRLRLGHASRMHFRSAEYLQAFSLAWTTVEKSLGQMWKRFLVEAQIGGKRLQQLTGGDQFTSFVIIEALNLCGQLSTERHSRLQRLRKLRNYVMHEGAEPSFQNVADCIQEANTCLASSIEE